MQITKITNSKKFRTNFHIYTVESTKLYIWVYIHFQFDVSDAYQQISIEKPT